MITKRLEGVVVTSNEIARKQIVFDIESGLIVEQGDLAIPQEKIDFFYDDECLVFAGMGDIHIHAREDVSQQHVYKEDFLSVGQSALNGGLTFLADMPNNVVPPICDKSYLDKLSLTEKSKVPVLLYAGIGPNTAPLSFDVPYKVYMGPSTLALGFSNEQELEQTLSRYKGKSVSFHCEDPSILEGKKGEKKHSKKRPVDAEIMASEIAIRLIEKFSLIGKLCHFSSGKGMELVNSARQRGVDVACECTPQHLYFANDGFSQGEELFFQMNPPIRNNHDRQAMLDSFKKGEVDYLVTDHAPHTLSEKKKGISGLTGLDSYVSFITWAIKEQSVDPKILAKVCSENPGLFFNRFLPVLKKNKSCNFDWGKGAGFIAAGFLANFTVINMEKTFTLSTQFLKTKAKWSPFVGKSFPGRLQDIFLSGKKM